VLETPTVQSKRVSSLIAKREKMVDGRTTTRYKRRRTYFKVAENFACFYDMLGFGRR